jgi:hypothetical protein
MIFLTLKVQKHGHENDCLGYQLLNIMKIIKLIENNYELTSSRSTSLFWAGRLAWVSSGFSKPNNSMYFSV